MTRWLVLVVINIIWTKKIYNSLHVRHTSRKFAFSDDASRMLSHTHSPSRSLFLFHTSLFHTRIRLSLSRVLIQLTYSSLAIARVSASFGSCRSCVRSSRYLRTFYSQQSWRSPRRFSRPPPRAKLTWIFRSNKYQQRDSYTGSRTLA